MIVIGSVLIAVPMIHWEVGPTILVIGSLICLTGMVLR